MPFDGKPSDYETKIDVCSLESFARWAESKNPDEKYDYPDRRKCVYGQLSTEQGVSYEEAIGKIVRGSGLFMAGTVASTHPWTFGALAKRIRALSQSTPNDGGDRG